MRDKVATAIDCVIEVPTAPGATSREGKGVCCIGGACGLCNKPNGLDDGNQIGNHTTQMNF